MVYYAKLALMFSVGYMLKSLLVTIGPTTENLTVNLILLIGSIAAFVILGNIEEKDDE